MGKKAKRSKPKAPIRGGKDVGQKASKTAGENLASTGESGNIWAEVANCLSGICVAISAIFLATDHLVLGIWFGLATVASLLATLAYVIAKKHSPARTWFAYAIFLSLAGILSVKWSTALMKPKPVQESELSGVLIPAHDPNPTSPVLWGAPMFPTNMVNLYLGKGVSQSCWFPHTVISFKGKSLLTISTNAEGAQVSGKLFGDNGNIVCELENNEFTINQNNYFKKKRPDRSTLIVIDQKDQEILNVRFLNPQSIRLNCRLRLPDGRYVIISPDEGPWAIEMHSVANMADAKIE